MTRIILEVNHEPAGQPANQIRMTSKGPRLYRKASHPAVSLKRAIQAAWMQQRCKVALTGPISVWIYAWFRRPVAEIRKTKPMPARRHCRKPDADNIAKCVLDALNKLAWNDDGQVSDLVVSKRVMPGTDPGKITIVIEGES